MSILRNLGLTLLLLGRTCGFASAHDVKPGVFQCALMAQSAEAALAARASGKLPVKLEINRDGFWFGGGLLILQGPIKAAGSAASTVKEGASAVFDAEQTVLLDATDDPAFATASFGIDQDGKRAALLLSRNGKAWFACAGENTAAGTPRQKLAPSPDTPLEPPPTSGGRPSINNSQPQPGDQSSAEPAPIDPALAEGEPRKTSAGGIDGGDLALPPPPAPKQKGKEASILGPVKAVRVEAGRYQCTTASFYSDGDKRESKSIGSLEAKGFDLYGDGGYRIDGKEAHGPVGSWRSGPAAGAIAFTDGSLSIYLKEPVHVIAKGGIHLIYQAEYDYDDRLDSLILCGRAGAPMGRSPRVELADKGKKNLAAPPPGETRISGLFYKIDWRMMPGANFTTYQVPYYTFRHFQENGYVWLGEPPADGDFSKLACDKPKVDDQGEPLCTSYAIENGKIRIGNDAPVSFATEEKGIGMDSDSYFRIDPANDLKLDRRYSYFSYNGVAAFSGGIEFTKDGGFKSDSSVGISYTTPDVGGPQTTVTGHDEKAPTVGRYAINGYTLEITNANGQKIRKFFAVLSEGMLYFNGDAYLDR
jgi:hypothetical protein